MSQHSVFFTRRLIEDAIATTGAQVSRGEADAARMLIKELGRSFCSGELDWESITVEMVSQRRDYAKEDVCQFVDGQKCLLVTNEGDVFEVKNGDSLRLVFNETPGFVLYVCDAQMTYLLCVNDHRYLIGCGRSIPFVAALEPQI